MWSIRIADTTLWVLWVLLLAVGALTLARTLLMFVFAVWHARRRRATTWSWGAPVTDAVSVIVPAYNERETIGPAVRSLALSAHRDVEVVVVDDASTDGTAEVVEALALDNVRVAKVPGGGKATALNTGFALARHDLVVMVDADTVVEPDSIHRLVQPFADATGGCGRRQRQGGQPPRNPRPAGSTSSTSSASTWIAGCTTCSAASRRSPGLSGRSAAELSTDAGSVSVDTIAEDTDLTMAIHRAGWRVVYEESARAFTEAPASLSQLWSQRYRWSYGTMQAMWKHRRAIVDGGPSGRFGRRGLPFIAMFTVLLPLLAPLLDILAVYGAVFLNRWETVIGWLAVLVVQTITAILAFRLDREPLRPLWALPLQQFVYRQVMYVVLLQSAITALTGRRLRWQKLRRSGDVALATEG